MEENFDFINQKVTVAKRELIQLDPNNTGELDFSGVNNIEGARSCLSAFFGILLDANVHKRRLEMDSVKTRKLIQQKDFEFQDVTKSLNNLQITYNAEIEQLTQEFAEKERTLV